MGEFYGIPREKLQEEAKKKGLKVVFPNKNQLFVDIDSRESMKICHKRIDMLKSLFDCKLKKKVSRSGHPHYHIYIDAKRTFTDVERILLQLFLGSDANHEFLSYKDHTNGESCPVLFFERANEI